MNNQLLSIKAKKFGVRLAGFRQQKGISMDALSNWTGISQTELEMIESGETSITLPKIELIANKLGVNTETLLNGKLENEISTADEELFREQFTSLRDRVIALILLKTRTEKEISIQEAADRCGVTEERLHDYEGGKSPIPWPVLEQLCEVYEIPVSTILSDLSKEKILETAINENQTNVVHISNEMDTFIQNPANLPYIELAKKLSEIDAAKLRGIAEGLLEITY